MRDPFASTRLVLVPYIVSEDGTMTAVPMWAPDGQDAPLGFDAVRRGPSDAFQSGALGFQFTGSMMIPVGEGEPVRHTFSGNAVEPKTGGFGIPRPKVAKSATGGTTGAAAARYGRTADAGDDA